MSACRHRARKKAVCFATIRPPSANTRTFLLLCCLADCYLMEIVSDFYEPFDRSGQRGRLCAPKKLHSQHQWSAKHSEGRCPFLSPDLETEPVKAIYGKFADTFIGVLGEFFHHQLELKDQQGKKHYFASLNLFYLLFYGRSDKLKQINSCNPHVPSA